MKNKLGSKSTVLLSAALVAALGAPIAGSAAGLANSPIHVRALNDADKSFSAIKPGLKSADPTGSPSSSSSPSPTSPPVSAQPNPASDFTWTTTATAATITGYIGTAKDVVLPESYRYNGVDLPVTTIGSQAFKGTPIESVVLPRSMTRVSANSFMSASSLKSVSIPDTITSIASYAFYGTRLESLDLPDSVTTIGTYAFSGVNIGSLKLPEGVNNVGVYAFYKSGITELKLPSSLKTLNIQSFGNNPLTTVTVPSTVTSIGDRTFDGPSLQSVYMEGNAPTTFTSAGTSGSFGVASGKTVYYRPGATGYTATWKGYKTATY